MPIFNVVSAPLCHKALLEVDSTHYSKIGGNDGELQYLIESPDIYEPLLKNGIIERRPDDLPQRASDPEPVDSNVSPDAFLVGDRNAFDPNTFAKWLIDTSGSTFATLSDTDEVLRYDGGVYLKGGDVEIRKTIERVMDGFKVSKFNVNEVIGHIQRRTYAKREDFDVDPNIINLDNGRFDFGTMEFKPHTAEYLSLHKSPIVYDPEARCEQVDRFFSEVLQEHDVSFMYELFGYALLKEKRMQAAVMLEGEARTGKSTMIELFEAFVGSNLCSRITPTELSGDDRFATSDLYGMLLNMVDDLGNTPLKNLGTFKSVVSNKKIRGQKKNQVAFDFVPYVLCVFACNEVPMTYDTSDAFFRRMMIVSFLQKFEGRRDTETTKADNPRLIDDITSRGEISGLFNSAIQAAKVMLERGSFSGVNSIDERKRAYLYASNPVARFVDELCDVTDPDALIKKDDLYHAFILWCRDGGIRVVDKGKMTTYLEGLGCVVSRPQDEDGGRYLAYTGVNMKGVGRCGKCGGELCGETFRGPAGLGLICADCQAELNRSSGHGRVEQEVQITDTVNRLGRDSTNQEFTVVNVLMELPKRQGFTTEKIELFMNEHASDLKIERIGGGVWCRHE